MGLVDTFSGASATLAFTASQRIDINVDRPAAVTLALPQPVPVFIMPRKLHRHQPPEPLAGQVNQLTHAVPPPVSWRTGALR